MNDLPVSLHHSQLQRWPSNLRQRYNPADVERMADSQRERAERGQPPCIQALIVTPGPGKPLPTLAELKSPKTLKRLQLFICAGHLRHAGNAHLGSKAPLLNCVIRSYATEAEMKADMRTENGQRAEPSPLDWARHFQSELEAGVLLHTLIKQSGKTRSFIDSHLSLLKLSPEAQRLIDDGDLAVGAAEHLLEIEDLKVQARLARRLRGHSVPQLSRAVTLYLSNKARSRKGKPQQKPTPFSPSGRRAGDEGRPTPSARPATDGLPSNLPVPAADLRAFAALTCKGCSIGKSLAVKEPAWHILLAAAGETCSECDLKQTRGACAGCPLAETMSRLARHHGAQVATAKAGAQ